MKYLIFGCSFYLVNDFNFIYNVTVLITVLYNFVQTLFRLKSSLSLSDLTSHSTFLKSFFNLQMAVMMKRAQQRLKNLTDWLMQFEHLWFGWRQPTSSESSDTIIQLWRILLFEHHNIVCCVLPKRVVYKISQVKTCFQVKNCKRFLNQLRRNTKS